MTRNRLSHSTIRFGLLLAVTWAALAAPAWAQTVLRIPIPADPLMNPVIGKDAAAVAVNRFFFDTLTRPDPKTLEPRPGLATEWSARPDGLLWTFKLVRNAKWHDGKPFTADDVKFTYDVILDPKQNSPRRSAIASSGRSRWSTQPR